MTKTIFKCRSKTLNIKDHTKFKNSDCICRWCGSDDETLQHIVNCGSETTIVNVETMLTDPRDDQLEVIAQRVQLFLTRVDV